MLYELEDGETIYEFVARIESLGLIRKTNQRTSSTIAYAGNSLMMRQKQSETIYQYSGLTIGAATQMVELLNEKNSNRVIYYHTVGNDGDAVAVGVTKSPKNGPLITPDKEYQLSRVGDSEAYVVTLTETTWEEDPVGSGWTTSRPSATGNGVVISQSGSAQFLFAYRVNAEVHTFSTTESVKITKYSFRTKSEAASLVTANTSNNASYQTYRYGTTSFYAVALTGTIKSAVSRYIDGDSQYTVEVTERTLGGRWS